VYARLTAIHDRLLRADENIEEIRGALRVFHGSDAYNLRAELDLDDDQGLHLLGALIPPPLRVFTLVGDILHELRSALDHLAWQMVRENGGEPDDSTYFPILPVPRDAPQKGPNRGKHPLPNVQGGVSDAARAVLEEAQPYKWGDDYAKHPFWVLNWLNIRDKHRHIAIRGVDMTNIVVGVGLRPLGAFTMTVRTLGASEHGAECEFVPDDSEVDVKVTGTLQVSFHEIAGGPKRPLFETITQMRDAVWEVFRDAEARCFPATFDMNPP